MLDKLVFLIILVVVLSTLGLVLATPAKPEVRCFTWCDDYGFCYTECES